MCNTGMSNLASKLGLIGPNVYAKFDIPGRMCNLKVRVWFLFLVSPEHRAVSNLSSKLGLIGSYLDAKFIILGRMCNLKVRVWFLVSPACGVRSFDG